MHRFAWLGAWLKSRSLLELAFFTLLAAWLLLNATGVAPGFAAFTAFVEFILGTILLVRLGRTLIRKSIWRLRNRLIVTYLFIGVVPIVLILLLVAIGGYIVAGQVAVFLVSSELDRRLQSLNEPAQILSWSSGDTSPRVLNQMAPILRNHFPNIQILVHTNRDFFYPSESRWPPPPPGWKDAKGLMQRDGHYYEWAHVLRDQTEVVFLEPLTNRVLSELVPHLGQVLLSGTGERPLNFESRSEDRSTSIPPPKNRFDREVTWIARVPVADWNIPGSTRSHLLVVTTRPSALLGAVFGDQFDIGQLSLYGFLTVLVLFVLVVIASLFAGVSLTRTITGSVHNLYEGTQKVTGGDFSHRIEVHGRDQLADLSSSFNSMTENLERLFAVEKEKERLQSELEIAKEVQNQLFPKDVPTLDTMDLSGLCRPARMVSGDYYDFFCLDDRSVAIAIGDVAGKGISAALLMASIQSIMRTQLSAGHSLAAAAGAGSVPCSRTSDAVSLLNRQLYAHTSLEKYATFFFGLYNEDRRTLSYTNAGHLQPILIRANRCELLEVTGTVVGAFPKVRYEERTIAMQPGDLLVAYTDGIAEPENEYGEEFGCERLTDLLVKHSNLDGHEIILRVMDAVQQWSTAPELPDDMTVLVAKIR